ncbi:hypothetical protein CP97_14727 [Aurantiacibacter atlanticus]|uniref:Uncharacterized protein n=1 Tax=Aurantiacibacter atlanticus TaxID=1648404 RepID=A0A168M1I7_9SPHN|nr:hypothetical protein [Aurantiacibacter atlanticus]ANC50413.1 hypothetical protein CP97_14727 [Aurantiacibacter atlanticus]MDF1835182.1 hypothetical protein [Alteraurantiacibacter sp. bin_em_oilr2.035]
MVGVIGGIAYLGTPLWVESQLADPVGAAGLDEAELRSWLVDDMRWNLG